MLDDLISKRNKAIIVRLFSSQLWDFISSLCIRANGPDPKLNNGLEIFGKSSQEERESSLLFLNSLLKDLDKWNTGLGFDVNGKETKFHTLKLLMEEEKKKHIQEKKKSPKQEEVNLVPHFTALIRV